MATTKLIESLLKELRPLEKSKLTDAQRRRVSNSVELLESHLIEVAKKAEKRQPFILRLRAGLNGSAKAVYLITAFLAALVTIILAILNWPF